MDDAVDVFKRAAVDADIPTLMTTLADDACLVSPLVGGATFRGHDDLRILLTAVYTTISGLTWTEHHRDGATHVVLGAGRVAGRPLVDAMIVDTNDAGMIQRIRPHLGPWSGLTAFAVAMGPKLARHPGVLRRAAQASAAG
ncbi:MULTISPECIES: hypothetical protein [Arsenicicoccus]|uniref:hypothetical protein n=1 Tax=Arsenicicoccus TaxID=267408 RepID=UPI000311039C|nr:MULTISPECIES: hypothetical protein [Arsenicicoccus]